MTHQLHRPQPGPSTSASHAQRSSGARTSLWLGSIVAAAVLLRSFALLRAIERSSAPFVDPDRYLAKALLFVAHGGRWHWNPKGFMYGPLVKAPLYPFVLSLFAPFPTVFPLSAAIMQIVVGTGAVAGLYVIGREVHSPRAGLIAAGIYACWLPSISAVSVFLQEQLHVPLVVIGLALLTRASARASHPNRFALAGIVLGLAALVRSMPLYYVFPAALLYVALVPDRRTAVRQALALLLGFFLVVLPWCAYMSARTGQIVLVDTMGSAAFGMTYRDARPETFDARPPTAVEGVGMVVWTATRDPARFWGDRVADFQRLFRLVGGQWLELGPPVASRADALALKGIAHASDALFALSCLLAPLGVVLARRRREALLMALWVVVNLGLLVMFAWNGVRYRAPYEPALIGLAAVVLAGGWVRPPRLALGLALATSVVIGAAVAVSLPDTADAGASYGFREWVPAGDRRTASIVGDAGFTVLADGRTLGLRLSPTASASPETPVRVSVFLDGREADRVALDAGARELRYPWAHRAAYVELRATFERDQRPAPFLVDVVRPRH